MAELVVIHGFPGAGKSTQAERLAQDSLENRRMIHVSAGTRLRDIRTGNASSAYQDIIRNPNTPLPIDNDIVNSVLFELIPSDEPNTFGLIDGYPRHADAVDTFMEASHERQHRLIGCVSLELSLETSLSRIVGRGVRNGERLYDRSLEEHTRKRYQNHLNETMGTIEHMSTMMPLVRINAEGGPEEVWEQFHSGINHLIAVSGVVEMSPEA